MRQFPSRGFQTLLCRGLKFSQHPPRGHRLYNEGKQVGLYVCVCVCVCLCWGKSLNTAPFKGLSVLPTRVPYINLFKQ